VLVVDDGDIRYLRFGNVEGDDQSEISLSDPDAVPMEYIRYATIGLAYTRGRGRTLMIGLGGGTFTTMLRRLFPDMWIEVAEIDPVVADVAKRFFGLREDDRYHVHIGDGRAYVERSTEMYDLVLLDAFSGAGIPAHLGRRDFFELVRTRLAEGGAVVANIAAADDAVERGLVDAFREAFPLNACFETPESGNIVLVGVVGRPLPDAAALRDRARTLGAALDLPFDLVEVAARLGTGCI
jgi:spermidine synthase